MEVILFQPEIPQNTGNIVRTCSVTGAKLTLVKPLGFSVSDKSLKRSGLDYWNEVSIDLIDNLEELLSSLATPFYFFSSKATRFYDEITFTEQDKLIFGSETSGLPPYFFEKWPEAFYKIPMLPTSRCLNLSNAVAVVLYESLRQRGFKKSLLPKSRI